MTIAFGLHHSSLPVASLARSLEFYVGVLDLAVLPRPDLGVAGAWLAVGDSQIHLIEIDPARGEAHVDVGAPPRTTNPLGRHLALAVADMDATVTHLETAGVAVTRFGSGSTQCWVSDPDGHVVEFIVPAT